MAYTISNTLKSFFTVLALVVATAACDSDTNPPPEPTLYSSGSFIVRQTWWGDLDEGMESTAVTVSEADFWFEADTETDRFIAPINGATGALLGALDTSHENCVGAGLSDSRIAISEIEIGDLLCFRTGEGRLSAFQLTDAVGPSPGELHITYMTWNP